MNDGGTVVSRTYTEPVLGLRVNREGRGGTSVAEAAQSPTTRRSRGHNLLQRYHRPRVARKHLPLARAHTVCCSKLGRPNAEATRVLTTTAAPATISMGRTSSR